MLIDSLQNLSRWYRSFVTLDVELTRDKKIIAVNREKGLMQIQANAIILAMGCRERTRGAINIPGYRPAGIYTAYAQKICKYRRLHAWKEIMILGSGI